MVRRKIFFIFVVLGVALLFAWSRIRVIELGYEVSGLKSEIEKMKQNNSLLKSRLAKAISTEELARLALQHRMQGPASDKILFLAEEKE